MEVEQLESLGDSITTAVLLNWTKEAGEGVAEDDVIGVVETDKVTMDIRAKKRVSSLKVFALRVMRFRWVPVYIKLTLQLQFCQPARNLLKRR